MAENDKQEDKALDQAREEAGVATAKQNEKLEHSEGGATTRDGHDLGVPMLPGDPSEPVGPEDALGEGPKRGDYRERVPGNPHQGVAIEGGGEPIRDKDGNLLDFTPSSAVVPQKPRTEDIGDEPGVKGGVDTDPLSV